MADPKRIALTVTVQGATREKVQIRDLTERAGHDLVCLKVGGRTVFESISIDFIGTLDELTQVTKAALGQLNGIAAARKTTPVEVTR